MYTPLSRLLPILVVLLLGPAGCEQPVAGDGPEARAAAPVEMAAIEEEPPTAADLPGFLPAAGVAGSLRLVADAESLPLAEGWARALERAQPGLVVRVESLEASAPGRWWQQDRDAIALRADAMGEAEANRFSEDWGRAPRSLAAALDPLVVIAAPRNPVARTGLHLGRLAAIYAATDAVYWGDLRLGNVWARRPVERIAHDTASPLARYFAQEVLAGVPLAPEVTRLTGPGPVVEAVAASATALGFTARSVARRSGGVSVVPLAADDRSPVAPTPAAVYDGRYPLPNPTWLHLNPATAGPRQQALVRFAASREGQTIAEELGYIPLPPELAQEARGEGGE